MATFKTTLFTVIGACIILATLVSAWGTQHFVAGASSAPGVVTRLNAGGSHPEVRFTTAEGRTVEFALNGLIFGYGVGDRVKILYNPRRPTEATADTFGALWGFTLLFLGMGAAFVGASQLVRRRPDLIG